jgi:hypothetical protein
VAFLRVLFIGFSTVLLCSCAAVPRYCESLPSYVTGENPRIQEKRLYCAYRDDSQQRLATFFDAWSSDSQEITPAELGELPQALQHAYAIFEDFYRPKDLRRVGDAEWGPEQFAHAKYFLVRTDLRVTVKKSLPDSTFGNSDDPSIAQWEVERFSPRASSDVPLCYLDDRYANLIRRFLGDEELPMGHSGIMSTSVARGESLRRQEFINQLVQVYHGHWGGWNLSTDPSVYQIEFDETMENAKLYFSLVYEGGEALYARDSDSWRLVRSELTWIE